MGPGTRRQGLVALWGAATIGRPHPKIDGPIYLDMAAAAVTLIESDEITSFMYMTSKRDIVFSTRSTVLRYCLNYG